MTFDLCYSCFGNFFFWIFFVPLNLLLLFKPGTFHKLMIRVVGTTKTTPNRGPLLLGKLWFPKSLAVMV